MASTTATMVLCLLSVFPAAVVAFGPSPPNPPNPYNCTKSGCWFSYTNPASLGKPPKNQGRCGEVDAAPRMPPDIWRDQTAVNNYALLTIEAERGLSIGQCHHDPLAWYQNGNASIDWFGQENFVNMFGRACQNKQCKAPFKDDPRNHLYCSLCELPGKYNAKDTVEFWYPRATTQNIVELAEAVPDLSTLVTAIVAGNLANLLSTPGPFTVFAPNNEAFNKIPAIILKNLLKPTNVKELDRILELHVIDGAAFAKDLKNGEKIKTVSGDELTVTITKDGKIFLSSTGTRASQVIAADVRAKNGVVHVVDTVLLPSLIPPSPPQTIVDLAAADPDLSTLVTALKAGDLVSTLSGTGPFTVFAPTNEAFAKLPAGVLANLLKPENKVQLDKVLTYHVHAGTVYAGDLKDGEMILTVEGADVTVRIVATVVFINSAEVITPNLNASNGVVHIIDGVLLPPAPAPPAPTIAAVVAGNADFSTLNTALKAGLLIPTLSGTGPFTVFAPTNEAFNKLPAGVLANLLKPENRGELIDLLGYHVVGSIQTFAHNMPKRTLMTLAGRPLQVSWHVAGGGNNHNYYYLSDGSKNGQRFDPGKDVTASNGIVYPIDTVLTPHAPLPTIVQIASSDKDFSTLVVALKAADLVSTLNGTGPFTVFAPTNEAFDALPAGVLSNLLLPQNKAKLVDLLLYHVHNGKLEQPALNKGDEITTVEGKNLTVTSTDACKRNPSAVNCVAINNKFIRGSENASNGIVHNIEGVLIPPTM